MNKTNKSGKKKPRRRYFRRGDAKTNESQPVNESNSEDKSSNELNAPEKSKPPSSSEDRSESRSSRRRSRSEKRRVRVERSDSTSQRSGGGLRRRSNSDARSRRQKRRHGEREDQIVEQTISGPSIIEAIAREYEPPEDIYTYTHIIRPDQRDTYEFRSDHFSNTSRHLEDYAIDLSPILTETGEIAFKNFFQDIPHDEDSDRANLEGSLQKPIDDFKTGTGRDSDKREPIEDDFVMGFDDFFEDDFQHDPEENFEGEGKSLEQIYDELEMFKNMEI